LQDKLLEKQKQTILDSKEYHQMKFRPKDEQDKYMEKRLNLFKTNFYSITDKEWLNYLWGCFKKDLLSGKLTIVQNNTLVIEKNLIEHAVATGVSEDGVTFGLINSQDLSEILEDTYDSESGENSQEDNGGFILGDEEQQYDDEES
jgi:hypothetical protein